MAIKGIGNPAASFRYRFGRTGDRASKPFVPFSATGGDIANGIAPGNGYKYHTFGSPGTFTVTSTGTVEVLVVAGGGGGGSFVGGGGGAGGVIYATAYAVSSPVSVTIGNGGSAGNYPPPAQPVGTAGNDSVFGLLTAKGGGRGGSATPVPQNGTTGGSGGGGGATCPPTYPNPFNAGLSATQPTTPQPGAPGPYTQYGNAGGNGSGFPPNGFIAGGGGGAGGAGVSVPSFPSPSANPNNGGAGQPFPAFAYPLCFPSPYLPGFATPGNPKAGYTSSPTSDHYGGGGGGGRHLAGGASSQPITGAGGAGGGGQGGNGSGVSPYSGLDYLGGGGGDGFGYGSSGTGGKGVVIIRYLT